MSPYKTLWNGIKTILSVVLILVIGLGGPPNRLREICTAPVDTYLSSRYPSSKSYKLMSAPMGTSKNPGIMYGDDDDERMLDLVESEKAFYFPVGFSLKRGLDHFTVLDFLDNGTIVYAFIGEYSGDISKVSLNTVMPYQTDVTSDAAGSKVLTLMACNALAKEYAIYRLDKVEEDLTFVAQKQSSADGTLYVLSDDTTVDVYSVARMDTLPILKYDGHFSLTLSGFEMSSFSRAVTRLSGKELADGSLQIMNAQCVDKTGAFVEFYVEYERPEETTVDESYDPENFDRSTWEGKMNDTDVSETDIPDRLMMFATAASLTFEFPETCEPFKVNSSDAYVDAETVSAAASKAPLLLPDTAGKTYVLEAHNGKYVSIAGASLEKEATANLWERTGGSNQRWRITLADVDSFGYMIQSVNSKQYLDVAGASSASGTDVIQWSYNGEDNQLWYLEDAGDGYVFIRSGMGTYMDVDHSGTANGTNIWAYEFNGTDAQRFKILEVDSTGAYVDAEIVGVGDSRRYENGDRYAGAAVLRVTSHAGSATQSLLEASEDDFKGFSEDVLDDEDSMDSVGDLSSLDKSYPIASFRSIHFVTDKNGGEHLLVNLGDYLTASFPVIRWEKRNFSRLDGYLAYEKVELLVPVVGEGFVFGVTSESKDVNGSAYIPLNNEYLSRYKLEMPVDEDDDEDGLTFDAGANDDKSYLALYKRVDDGDPEDAILTVPDAAVSGAHSFRFGSRKGLVFLSEKACYVSPSPLISKDRYTHYSNLYRIEPDQSFLTITPESYSACSFCPLGSDGLLLASPEDGVVRCDFTANRLTGLFQQPIYAVKKTSLWEWPTYMVSQAKGGGYWAVGFQTTGSVTSEDMLRARIYKVDLDEKNSVLVTIQKSLQADPTLWSQLRSVSGRTALWRRCYPSAPSGDYQMVKADLRQIAVAYSEFTKVGDELSARMDALHLLSGDQRIELEKALFACKNSGQLEVLLERIYTESKIPGEDDQFNRAIGLVKTVQRVRKSAKKEVPTDEDFTPPPDIDDFKREVALARIREDETKNQNRDDYYVIITEYADWIDELDAKIEPFQAALGVERDRAQTDETRDYLLSKLPKKLSERENNEESESGDSGEGS